MDDKFAAGDVVKLKSGGPTMTVDHAGKTDCKVSWFCGFELRHAVLCNAALRKVKAGKST